MDKKTRITIFSIFLIIVCIFSYYVLHRYLNREVKIIQAKTVKVTLPEGLSNEQMADILASKLSFFNKKEFLENPNNKQGYLFPDTYFFVEKTNTLEVNQAINNNFKKKIESIDTDIINSGKSLNEILTMASILEEESSGSNDIEIISGILWKRIKIGLPLQVDAYPMTYSQKGLPKSPISNPGLISIHSAIYPKYSNYLYYLHDKNGIVHYASSYHEHKKNINTYLK